MSRHDRCGMKRPRPPQHGWIRHRDRCANPRLRSEEGRSCAPAPRLWIENVTQTIAEQVQAEHRQEYREAGEDRKPRRRCDLVAGLRQHAAPAWIGWADSEAKE